MKKIILPVLFFLCYCGSLTAGTLGDVNGDGKVDITEAVYSLQTAAGLKPVIPDGSPVFADDQGKIGIGTAEPSANLDVKGNFSRRLIGRVGVPKNSKTVVGVGTLFTEELKTGDSVIIADEVFTVSEIVSNSQLVLNSPHSTGTNDSEIHADSTLFSVRNGDGVEKLAVDKSGNVSIGKEEPKAKLDIAGDVAVNGIKVIDNDGTVRGVPPVGTVLAWHKNFSNTPPLAYGWVECNGQVITDSDSPYNGQTLPNLNGNKYFLRGDNVSGNTGGSETHTHSFEQTSVDYAPDASHVTDGSFTNPANHLPPYYGVVWIIKIK